MKDECTRLLILVFQFLDEDIKSQFSDILDSKNHKLDVTLWEMIQKRIFPEWFCREFRFYNFDSTLVGLRDILSEMYYRQYLRIDGTNYDYHIDPFSSQHINFLLRKIEMEEVSVKKIALVLNNKLKEKMSLAS